MNLEELADLNLDSLRILIDIKEKFPELLRLETRREKLAAELIDLNIKISELAKSDPEAAQSLGHLRKLSSAQAANAAGGESRLPTSEFTKPSRVETKPKRRARREPGVLRKHLHAIMAHENQTFTPAQLRDSILERDPKEDKQTLYQAVVQVLTNGDEFYKSGKGWRFDRKGFRPSG